MNLLRRALAKVLIVLPLCTASEANSMNLRLVKCESNPLYFLIYLEGDENYRRVVFIDSDRQIILQSELIKLVVDWNRVWEIRLLKTKDGSGFVETIINYGPGKVFEVGRLSESCLNDLRARYSDGLKFTDEEPGFSNRG